ncbi:hypothetical protein [Kaarinaea lacus]
MAADELTKEQRILRMCRQVLTDIAKDTVTPAGMKHPLSESTIQGIRDCLQLITSREAEILNEQGRPSTAKPHFIDEPQKNVVVELTPKKPNDKKTEN